MIKCTCGFILFICFCGCISENEYKRVLLDNEKCQKRSQELSSQLEILSDENTCVRENLELRQKLSVAETKMSRIESELNKVQRAKEQQTEELSKANKHLKNLSEENAKLKTDKIRGCPECR